MTSYLTSIDTLSLSRTVFEIFDFKVFSVWPWPLTFRGHLGSKIFSPFESPYRTSYLISVDTFSLSIGGTEIIFKNTLKCKKMEFQLNPKTFVYVAGMFTLGATRTVVVAVYRPGSQNIGSPFFDEISRLFEMLVTYNCEIIITGDLNIHLDIVHNNHTIKFNQMLDCFGLSQHVAGPTHKAGHTLDVFITKTDQMLPFDTSVYPPVISDHSHHCGIAT